jgi:hypothetical protein
MPPHDTRAILRDGPFTVLAQRHEVMFHDGLAVGLHPVASDGQVQVFLRAVHADGLRWVLFDLRHVPGELHDDLLRLQPRDHIGAVFYTLRLQYRTRQAFVDALDKLAVRTWRQSRADGQQAQQAQQALAA